MNTNQKNINFIEKSSPLIFENWDKQCSNYIKKVIDTVREPVLLLDNNLRVLAANESFYKMFQVEQINTEGRIIYELGSGQWDIPALRKLLEDILPSNSFFKGFEVIHDFEFVGHKELLLNARGINSSEITDVLTEKFPPVIFLAIEDVTNIMTIAETFAVHVKEIARQNAEETKKLQLYVEKLEKEIREIKKSR